MEGTSCWFGSQLTSIHPMGSLGELLARSVMVDDDDDAQQPLGLFLLLVVQF